MSRHDRCPALSRRRGRLGDHGPLLPVAYGSSPSLSRISAPRLRTEAPSAASTCWDSSASARTLGPSTIRSRTIRFSKWHPGRPSTGSTSTEAISHCGTLTADWGCRWRSISSPHRLRCPPSSADLAPLRYAYTTAVLSNRSLPEPADFFLCRKLGLSNLSGVFGGTIFELSGSFTGWLGWPQATVICLLGWVLGATVAILGRDGLKPRARSTTLLAVALAFVLYAGHPESVVFVAECMVVVVVVYLVARFRQMRGEPARALSPLIDLALASVAAVALAAPLLLPGIPILSSSARQLATGYTGLPRTYLINLVAPGYFGFPTAGSTSYGTSNYYETASYVGSITVILALFAVLCLWRRRAPRSHLPSWEPSCWRRSSCHRLRKNSDGSPSSERCSGLVSQCHWPLPSQFSLQSGSKPFEGTGFPRRSCGGCLCQRGSLRWSW